jgi:integrase
VHANGGIVARDKRQFGTIRKLPSGRFQALYSTPVGKRVTAPHTFAYRIDAEGWLHQRRVEAETGRWNPAAVAKPKVTFGDYATEWLASRQLRPYTRQQYDDILRRFLVPAFGNCALAAITPGQVREWHADTLTDKPTMRAHCYALLKAIMATALQDELIDANPCRIRGAGQTQRVCPIRPATVDELVTLTAAMPERLRLIVPLASWCGMRFGELIELRRSDVDLRDEAIRVRRAAVKLTGAKGGHVVGEPKSAAGIRDITIPPHLLAMIEAHLIEHVGPAPDALIFPSVPGGDHHLSLSANYRAWNKARTAAGRSDLRFHDLRHTGAVLAAVSGATLAELMARIGHSTARAALRYQHASQSRDREIAERLSKLAGGAPEDVRGFSRRRRSV